MGGVTDPPWQAAKAGDIESKRGAARGQISADAETGIRGCAPEPELWPKFPFIERKNVSRIVRNPAPIFRPTRCTDYGIEHRWIPKVVSTFRSNALGSANVTEPE
jgi:hypothetical protein